MINNNNSGNQELTEKETFALKPKPKDYTKTGSDHYKGWEDLITMINTANFIGLCK